MQERRRAGIPPTQTILDWSLSGGLPLPGNPPSDSYRPAAGRATWADQFKRNPCRQGFSRLANGDALFAESLLSVLAGVGLAGCIGGEIGSSLVSMEPPVISCDPMVMGGTPVFAGTRVPIQTLLDYLEAGESIDDFLAGFPSVSREQVIRFLEQAKDRLVAAAS